jgi:hypothetical protein
LPLVALHGRFALHGGTAINLFVQDMPRLSVDIDLTYVSISPRASALVDIRESLQSIKAAIIREIPGVVVAGPDEAGIESKLYCRTQGVQVKIEVNTIMRGLIADSEVKPLGRTAAEEFQSFCEVMIVPYAQLYGGKICAALDRQHPRDLFDFHLFLQEEINLERVKPGLIYALLSSNRPLHELLAPKFSNQEGAFYNQFRGMSRMPFSYADFEAARARLLPEIKKILAEEDKLFLLDFAKAEPTWGDYDFSKYPSIQWKLKNLEKFKNQSPKSFEDQVVMLTEVLENL